GFGRTSALQDDGGLPELAAWLVDWIRAEVGERPFAVLGNSLGGLLARHVAAEFGAQVLGLGLLAPVVDPDEDRRTRTD
ncbi:alpha/beta fold hydrolase, partial [Xanthomonas citri pv. citri]|nr:alpha/beta fold hydrolase [Xanthomonas citri pv. citri]